MKPHAAQAHRLPAVERAQPQPTTATRDGRAERHDQRRHAAAAGSGRARRGSAPMNVPARASQVQALRSPGCGWITSSTPTKPRVTALQRRQPHILLQQQHGQQR